MAEYIEREAINRISFTDAVLIDGEVRSERIVLARDIDKLPAADVEPVRHGRIVQTLENGRMKRVFSCCGTDFTKLTSWMAPNYCPNCGAKMD